jgi:hypothetical protein
VPRHVSEKRATQNHFHIWRDVAMIVRSKRTRSRKMSAENILADYLPRPKLAKQLGVSTRTLDRWAALRTGPPVTYIGASPHYSTESVRSWLKSREQKMPRARPRSLRAAANA